MSGIQSEHPSIMIDHTANYYVFAYEVVQHQYFNENESEMYCFVKQKASIIYMLHKHNVSAPK
jgi:hypothetical protein